MHIHHGSATGGPRANCGPPVNFLSPSNYFDRSSYFFLRDSFYTTTIIHQIITSLLLDLHFTLILKPETGFPVIYFSEVFYRYISLLTDRLRRNSVFYSYG